MTSIGLRYLSVIERLKLNKRVTIAGLGDSLTFGWMVENGFFNRFIDGLGEKFTEADLNCINAGLPGDTSVGGVLRADRLLSEKPHLLLIQFGINDCYKRISVRDYKNALINLASNAIESGCVPLLVTSCPMLDKKDQSVLEKYYSALCRTAKEHHIDCFDICGYWKKNSNGTPHELFLDDGVHPSDKGHALMAQGLLDLFTSVVDS